ncbi:phosphoglycolate phosphatase [Nitratireductor aquimarinus]|uniref:Phosphoglycolate phosphatase n=1 Tax=Nitratireductor aquimarinus TaxID=889300 RepID=A0ABU4ARB9_9HYPH|nr:MULTISPECIES: HAD family hydrolase [Alphaproteobacteria]MBY6020937.1 phosphoglycolate phosphatase [Nitratireductor sp. DP7N14-4]MBN7756151.1 phosphoglycolate phosphatase [Nitratireductor aquimarinus]MBN7778216.1 phosphoglycolate phosphatase [Nitratireductor pacificus]MBN7782538.1 phosphoglycolate phosphatase [Nitratireductor pacificus]MBN7791345.1 phosphoglycolate phosphatase [Nitratireductor aquimarinus]
MSAPIIVFDLDGTLVDTAPDLLDSLNHCLATVDMEPVKSEDINRIVGFGSRVMIERAFALRQRHLAEGQLDALQAIFLDHYTANVPGRSKPFPGAIEAIERFQAAGYTTAVCTNKLEGMSLSLLEALGVIGHFKAICGGDTFPMRKPDPGHLLRTIAMAGADPERAVMVGDSRTDIDTAKAAGIPVIAVDFGYTDRHVSAFEPSRVISGFDELTVEMAESLIAATAS